MAKSINGILFLLFICLMNIVVISRTFAATEIKSACFLDENSKEVMAIGKKTTDERYPIASVSKIFTSHMVASKFQVAARSPFVTQVFINEKQKGKFHVHIKGSSDPYFNRYKMHRIMSMLNEMGIAYIDLLTFDENVKFLADTESREETSIGSFKFVPVEIKAPVDFPNADQVKYQFQQRWTLEAGYSQSLKMAKEAGIKMVQNPKFYVKKVEYVYSKYVDMNAYQRSFYVESQSIATMLKLMNWNSNNFSANRFYLGAGGDDFFKTVYYDGLRLGEGDLLFVNGSGQNHDLLNNGRVYNEARCSVVVRVLRDLSRKLNQQKKQLFDILPVFGLDTGSTISGPVYTNELTNGKIAAKSGTIGTNVALAGVINTKKGNRYFMFNVELAQRASSEAFRLAQQNRGRRIIMDHLLELMKITPETIPFEYKPSPAFLSQLAQYGFENYAEDGGAAGPLRTLMISPVLAPSKP